MPSLDIPSLLLTIFIGHPEAVTWPPWHSITGLDVSPFSEACTADDLDMSEEEYEQALSFVVAWAQKAPTISTNTEETRLKFMRKMNDQWSPGRKVTQAWCKAKWKQWGIKKIIDETFQELGYEPFEFHKRNQLHQVSWTSISCWNPLTCFSVDDLRQS